MLATRHRPLRHPTARGIQPSDILAFKPPLRRKWTWWAVAADPATSDMYGILNGVGLTRLDFDQQPGTIVCKIEPADNLVAEDGWLFASNEITGTLQAIDPASKRVVDSP